MSECNTVVEREGGEGVGEEGGGGGRGPNGNHDLIPACQSAYH